MPAVVIAATSLMPSLRERLADQESLLTFADTEPIQALQAILEQRPNLIVLERLFAATPRGAALINRIKTDPQLGNAEVLVMSHTGDYTRQVAKPSAIQPTPSAAAPTGSGAAAAVETAPAADAPKSLDWHGTRRAPRRRVRAGLEIQVDGNSASVVDLSAVGAQVLSSTILRPNQKVRVSVPNDEFVMRFRGSIAWARFELPQPGSPPLYRAGVEFIDADAAALEHFGKKNKA